MADFLLELGKLNLAMCAAILIVYPLRRPIRAAFHAQIAYGLWLIVPAAAFTSMLPPREVAIGSIEVVNFPIGAGTLQPMLTVPHEVSKDWTMLLFTAWLIGTCGMALYLMRLQHKFHIAERAGAAGPAVAGFFRPRIVIPAIFEAQFSLREQEAIFAHERAHLTRQDARVNALIALVRCLCWFNPLVHIGSIWLRRDQELACDVAAVRQVSRLDYANALLKSQMPAISLPLGCAWPGSEHPLTERVALLKCQPPKPVLRWTGVFLIMLVTASSGLGAWAAQPATVRAAAAQTDPGLSNSRFAIRLVDESVDATTMKGPPGDDHVRIANPGVAKSGELWLKREGQINADALADAKASVDKSGKPIIEFRLTQKGSDQFAALTRANVGHRLAVVVNGKVIDVAVIMDPILTGRGQLSGIVPTDAEAQALVAEMMAKDHASAVETYKFDTAQNNAVPSQNSTTPEIVKSIGAETLAIADGTSTFKVKKQGETFRGAGLVPMFKYLNAQAQSRQLSGIYIIDATGKILGSVSKMGSDTEIPSPETIKRLAARQVIVSTNEHSKVILAVTKLAAFNDAYFLVEQQSYIAHGIQAGTITRITQ